MADFEGTFTGNDFPLMPREQYWPLALKALTALPPLDANPHDLIDMLFSEEEKLWLKKQLQSRRAT